MLTFIDLLIMCWLGENLSVILGILEQFDIHNEFYINLMPIETMWRPFYSERNVDTCLSIRKYALQHTIHFHFRLSSCSGCSGFGMTVRDVLRRIRVRFAKTSSTLWAVLAEVSMNGQPKDFARATPSAFNTSLSSTLSDWLPTKTNAGLCPFTLSIACRKFSSLSNVDYDVIEYTRLNPCPSLQTT